MSICHIEISSSTPWRPPLTQHQKKNQPTTTKNKNQTKNGINHNKPTTQQQTNNTQTQTQTQTTMSLSSAGGVLALLEEPDETLRVHALRQLDHLVDLYWSEIASSIQKMFVSVTGVVDIVLGIVVLWWVWWDLHRSHKRIVAG
jgi:hypothetical protein